MEKADIALITETKGQPPAIEGFTWMAKNREKGKGGGVAIGTRNKAGFQVCERKIKGCEKPETVWIDIKGNRETVIQMGCFYGPQENKRKEDVEIIYEDLKEQITRAEPKNPIILVGDFNAKMELTREGETIQKESRNGKIMNDFLEETGLYVINETSTTGIWTRVNRHNPRERSIIDYVTANSEGKRRIRNLEIDEAGTKRLKNTESESDHNTITFKISMESAYSRKKIRKWNIKSNTDWKEYNKELTRIMENKEKTYTNLQKSITEAMEKTVGQITITTNNKRGRENGEIKQRREVKKTKKKEMERAKKEEKEEKLQEYYEAQQQLRKAIAEADRENTKRTLERIAEDPNMIWSIRKKLMGKKKEEPDVITEEGVIIKDPEEAREYIASYYENLYQAREESEDGKEWTKIVEEKNRATRRELEKEQSIAPIRQKEMEKTKKRLKNKKSSGPDNIPNEPIKHANATNTRIIKECLNSIIKDGEIPEEWKKGRIISVYKGKGTRGKCSSERGITIGSNMGKVFERIINDRAKENLHISEFQGGGKKGASTVDHLTTLHETVRIGKNVYVTFLDVTKAYDKAWADGIMYVMEKEGIKDATWTMIRKLNEDLKAQVETKYGVTREITMKDNIRQGGVLSVAMYAVLMDEIAKEIEKKEMGVKITQDKKIGCLLWMDDVVLISEKKTEMQEMLNVVHSMATRYRLKFGAEKSKIMRIGKTQGPADMSLGDMKLEECKKYKYLGVIISEKGNMEEHIEETRRKTQGAYSTMMSIAGSDNLKCIEMKTIWKIIKASIIPIITYGWEARCPTKKEEDKLAAILNSILKRLLMTPRSTPNDPVYIETGIMEMGVTLEKQRINYMEKVRESGSKIMQSLEKREEKKGWWTKTENARKELVKDNWRDDMSQNEKKMKVNTAAKNKMMEKIKKNGCNKTKTKFYLDNKRNPTAGKCAKYMEECTRMEASIIIQARTRMLDTKGNYKNKYTDLKCRWCSNDEETQEHILEKCNKIDRTQFGIVTIEEIFEECPKKLKETAKRLHLVKKFLHTSAAP